MAERGAGGGIEAGENNLSHGAMRCRFSQRKNDGIHCLSLKPRSGVVSCVSLPRSPDAPDAGGLGNVRRTNHSAPSGIFLSFCIRTAPASSGPWLGGFFQLVFLCVGRRQRMPPPPPSGVSCFIV